MRSRRSGSTQNDMLFVFVVYVRRLFGQCCRLGLAVEVPPVNLAGDDRPLFELSMAPTPNEPPSSIESRRKSPDPRVRCIVNVFEPETILFSGIGQNTRDWAYTVLLLSEVPFSETEMSAVADSGRV